VKTDTPEQNAPTIRGFTHINSGFRTFHLGVSHNVFRGFTHISSVFYTFNIWGFTHENKKKHTQNQTLEKKYNLKKITLTCLTYLMFLTLPI